MTEPVAVFHAAPGWKCQRCYKVLPEVGLVPEHPDICLRCVAVVEPDLEFDVHALAAARFDRMYREERANGADSVLAIARAGRRNKGVA
jgi:hypothetical protein